MPPLGSRFQTLMTRYACIGFSMTQRLFATALLMLAALLGRGAGARGRGRGPQPVCRQCRQRHLDARRFSSLVVAVLGKFAWGPVLALLQEREEFIHKSLADAKHDREEAEARLKEYAAKLQSARGEAAAIVDEARRDAERLREDLRAERADRSRHDRSERGATDSAGDPARAPADPARSRRPVGARSRRRSSSGTFEGRQRAADR